MVAGRDVDHVVGGMLEVPLEVLRFDGLDVVLVSVDGHVDVIGAAGDADDGGVRCLLGSIYRRRGGPSPDGRAVDCQQDHNGQQEETEDFFMGTV